MTIVFFGSSSFSVPPLRSIQGLVDCVVTRKTKPKGRGYLLEDNDVKREALTLKIPLIEIDSFKDEEARQIGDLNPGLLVVASFGLIIPKWFLAIPTVGSINIHPSLLPRYRGPSPIQWAIWNGEKETGVTIMKMSEKMDAGDILYQETVPIEPGENAETLSDRLSAKAGAILPRIIAEARDSGVNFGMSQLEDDATYTPMITKEMGKIDWHLSSTEIVRQIRALISWPTAYGLLDGKVFKVFKARAGVETHTRQAAPGTIVAVSPQGIDVVAGEGSVVVEEVQLENRKRMSATSFARGYREMVGKHLT